jgi:hypothetical protein
MDALVCSSLALLIFSQLLFFAALRRKELALAAAEKRRADEMGAWKASMEEQMARIRSRHAWWENTATDKLHDVMDSIQEVRHELAGLQRRFDILQFPATSAGIVRQQPLQDGDPIPGANTDTETEESKDSEMRAARRKVDAWLQEAASEVLPKPARIKCGSSVKRLVHSISEDFLSRPNNDERPQRLPRSISEDFQNTSSFYDTRQEPTHMVRSKTRSRAEARNMPLRPDRLSSQLLSPVSPSPVTTSAVPTSPMKRKVAGAKKHKVEAPVISSGNRFYGHIVAKSARGANK